MVPTLRCQSLPPQGLFTNHSFGCDWWWHADDYNWSVCHLSISCTLSYSWLKHNLHYHCNWPSSQCECNHWSTVHQSNRHDSWYSWQCRWGKALGLQTLPWILLRNDICTCHLWWPCCHSLYWIWGGPVHHCKDGWIIVTVCASNNMLPSTKRIHITEPHKPVGTTSNSNSVTTILTNRSMTGRWNPPPSTNDTAHEYHNQILGKNGYLWVSYQTLTRYFMETSLHSCDIIHASCTFTIQSPWCVCVFLASGYNWVTVSAWDTNL